LLQSFKGYQHFEFSYIKDLAEPKELADEAQDDQKGKKEGSRGKEHNDLRNKEHKDE